MDLTGMVLPLYTQYMEKSPSRWWDLPSAVLLVLAVLISVWRLAITDWTESLLYALNLAVFGTVIGLALGASRFGKRAIQWLAAGYTLVLIPRQLIAAYDDEIYLGERLLGLGGRLLFSISEFAANKPVHDDLFLVTIFAIIYWFIGLNAGTRLARQGNTLAAILPAGLAIVVVQHFDHSFPNRIWFIAIYLFLALGLLGRGLYLRNREGWVKRGVHLAPEAGPDLSTGALIGAAVLILLAWSLPLNFVDSPLANTWEQITRPWRTTRDRMSRAFAAIEGEGDRVEYFRNAMPLGSKAAQENTLVFKVYADPEALELPRLYWRARVYDRYEDGVWSASETETSDFVPAGGNLIIPDMEKRREYEFAVTLYAQRQATLYLPAQPIWVSRPVDVVGYNLPDGARDVVVLEAFPFLESGETYHTRSAMADPSMQELRAAGQDYPEWVRERYLQLPEGFSQRVADFAAQMTFGLDTPYDKAEAITHLLRTRIEYKPAISLPAKGTDLMEWFLFESQEGYCNYYATAEVLMLRSLGIPARLAVGFSQGETAEEETDFIVYRKNSHAWPEVYFPGYGWVEFEPTGNQAPLERPAEALPETSNTDELETGDNPERDFAGRTPEDESGEVDMTPEATAPERGPIAMIVSGVILLAAAAFLLLNRKYALMNRAAVYILSTTERRGERSPAWVRNAALYLLASPFERAFHPVNLGLRWLETAPAPHLTPAERARELSLLLPDAKDEIESLLREYQTAQYSPEEGSLGTARRASLGILWKSLRAALRHAWE